MQRGEEAITTALRQPHVRDMLDTKSSSKLTAQELFSILAYLKLVKEKKSEEVRGEAVLMAGSRSKRHNYLGMVLDYSTKDSVNSPLLTTQRI